MISQKTIEAVFSAMRVEEIVGEYVQLKRAGASLKGLSPFKDEKTPSFVVSPSKQIWKDFSTGKGGNALGFLMEIEQFTYPEAIRYIAKKYGIEIEENTREKTPEELLIQSEKEQLFKIHEIASDFFHSTLLESEEGKQIGLSYFLEREIKKENIEKFTLGYSPSKKDAFTSFALEKGYSKEILEKSGLSIFPQNAENGIDRFRERVIFPIHSFSGRVLGFGARILKNNVKTAKYLNSPDTAIYHKSDVLYGLFQGKQAISRLDSCLLVEGYMDVIALHGAGIENVVSSSGTALTTEQIKLIKRLTHNVTILFDGDQAGIKASFRSIDLLLDEGMNIRVLLFPDGDDPDSFARKHSGEKVEEFIKEHSEDFIGFKAGVLLEDTQSDPILKAKAITEIVRSIGHVQNSLQQEIYIKEVAARFDLSERSLFNELALQKQVVKKEERKPEKPKSIEPKLEIAKDPFEQISVSLLLEEKLVELLFRYGEEKLRRYNEENQPFEISVAEEIVAHFKEDDYKMKSPLNAKILEEISEGLKENEIRSGKFFLTLLDQELNQKAVDALVSPYENSDWSKHNIFFSKEHEVLNKMVEEVRIRHKRAFVMELIDKEKEGLEGAEDPTEIYQKIIRLNQLRISMDEVLHRIV